MDIIIRKTNELSEAERKELLELFNVVFEKERTLEEFLNQYTQNPFGYSLHSIAIDKGKMVATQTYIPVYYLVEGKKLLVSCGADTAVLKPYRDFITLYDTIKALDNYSKENGFVFNYGFPNDNSYPVFKKAKLVRDIGKLDTYILPYRIGGVKKSLSVLNFASILFCRIYLALFGHGGSSTTFKYQIEKDLESYNKTRYKRMDGVYNVVHIPECGFAYKVMNYDGVRAAFLIDVFHKSERNFRKSVRYILAKDSSNFDLLLYVGHLPKDINIGLIKVPRMFEPKHFNFTAKIYDKKMVNPDTLFDIENWDVNLSNYDIV